MKIGLQVYSIRDDAASDFAAAMKKVKEMGYDGVELAGTYGLSAAEIKKVLAEVGLEVISAHIPLDDMEKRGFIHLHYLQDGSSSYLRPVYRRLCRG